MMADPVANQPRRLWKVVLILSLTLNLLVVGVIVGAVLRDDPRKGPRGFELAVGPLVQSLSPQDRRAIGQSLRRNSDLRPLRRSEALPGLTELVDVLRQDTLDETALREALALPSQRLRRVQDAAIDALAQRILEMSLDERGALADRIASQIGQGTKSRSGN